MISYLVPDDDKNEWLVDVFGGVGLLLAWCLQSVWYGFTRYPTVFEKDFKSWLVGGDSSRNDLEEIRNVCSEYFHGDESRRRQTIAVLLCAPVMVVDQLAASVSILLFSILIYLIKKTVGLSGDTSSFLRGVAKSVGAVLAAVAYYTIWMVGGPIAKFGAVVALLINQGLYTSILFRMGFVEFIFMQLFRGVISVAIKHHDKGDLKVDVQVTEDERNTTKASDFPMEDDSKDEKSGVMRELSADHQTGNGQSFSGGTGDLKQLPSFRNFDTEQNKSNHSVKIQVESLGVGSDMFGRSRSATSTEGNTIEVEANDKDLSQEVIEDGTSNFEIIPKGCDSYIVTPTVAIPGSRGPKVIDFTGEVYSACLTAKQAEDESRSGTSSAEGEPAFSFIFQGIKQRLNSGLFSGGPSGSLPKWEIPEGFVRSSTESTALSGGISSIESKLFPREPNPALDGSIDTDDLSSQHDQLILHLDDDQTVSVSNSVSEVIQQDKQPMPAFVGRESRPEELTVDSNDDDYDDNWHGVTPTGVDISRLVTIVREGRRQELSSHEQQSKQTPNQSPRDITEPFQHEEDEGILPVIDTISIHSPSLRDECNQPRGDFAPTTLEQGKNEKEAPPPSFVLAIEKASQRSLFDRPSLSAVNESSYESFDTMVPCRGSTLSRSSSVRKGITQPVRKAIDSIDGASGVPRYITVNLFSCDGSIDDEDVTLVGFDTTPSPHENSTSGWPDHFKRGRRPAPGRLDLPADAPVQEPDPSMNKMSTQRCDQFVFFDKTILSAAEPNA
jgi:hypothetical protein